MIKLLHLDLLWNISMAKHITAWKLADFDPYQHDVYLTECMLHFSLFMFVL